MLRVTEAQATLLFSDAGKTSSKKRIPGAPRVKTRKEDLPENIVTSTIKGFLEAHGWEVTRQQSGLFKRVFGNPGEQTTDSGARVRVGEKGIADWRAQKRAHGITFWICYLEFKAPGNKPSDKQLEWIRKRQLLGYPCDWFDGLDGCRKPFISWYRKTYAPETPLTQAEIRQMRDDDF